MLGNLPVEYSSVISKEHICEGTALCIDWLSYFSVFLFFLPTPYVALILLLKDPSEQVRISTAEAMSLLHGY